MFRKSGVFSKKINMIQGDTTLLSISADPAFVAGESVIPTVWPEGQVQYGHKCGLYAISIGLKCNGLDVPVQAEDAKKKDTDSLSSIATLHKWSAFGEIFDGETLKKMTDYVGFSKVDTSKPSTKNVDEYTAAICEKLKCGFNVIVSSDVDIESGMPGCHKGLGAHWALIFGYYKMKKKDELKHYFLVTHRGEYFAWDADALFESNKNMPKLNPYKGYIYTGDADSLSDPTWVLYNAFLKALYMTCEVTEPTLDKFKFTAFGMQNPCLAKKIIFSSQSKSSHLPLSYSQLSRRVLMFSYPGFDFMEKEKSASSKPFLVPSDR